MRSSVIARSALTLVVASVAVLAVAGHDGVSLKRKVAVGDVVQYKISAEFDSSVGAIKLTSTQSGKITKVNPDGSFVNEGSTSDTMIDVAGQEMPQPDSKASSEISANGRVKSITAEPAAEAATYRISHLTGFEAPDAPVNIGDEIKYTIPADKALGTPAMDASFKAVALEKVKDWDTVKFTYKSAETEGDTKASNAGTIWISTADGSIIKTDGKWTDVQPQGAPFPVSGHYVMERIK